MFANHQTHSCCQPETDRRVNHHIRELKVNSKNVKQDTTSQTLSIVPRQGAGSLECQSGFYIGTSTRISPRRTLNFARENLRSIADAFPPPLLTTVIAVSSRLFSQPEFIRARDCTLFSRLMHLEQPDDLLSLCLIEMA